MTATATFHFAAQASGLKYLIAPSASVTATGDSLTGIGSSTWEIVGTAGSVPADWVLSSAGLHSVMVTAPSGTNKAAILKRTVTSGRDTIVTTAKLYSGTELVCTNETFESDSSNGWRDLVNTAVANAGFTVAEAATASTIPIRDSSAKVHAAGVASDQTTLVCQPADRSTSGVGYGATFAAGKANGSNIGGSTTLGADNGGTPGTNLAGSVDFQLGTLVSNVSAKTQWLCGATSKFEASQTAANLFKLNAPSPMTLEVRAAGGGIAITPDSGSILRLGADSAGTQVASQTHVCANASGGLIQTFSPELYFNHTTIYKRTAAVSLKCTETISDTYVENYASGVSFDLQTNGTSRIKINGTGIGFFAATPAAKPAVTGSRGGNAALASLLTALATLGLITDSSSA